MSDDRYEDFKTNTRKMLNGRNLLLLAIVVSLNTGFNTLNTPEPRTDVTYIYKLPPLTAHTHRGWGGIAALQCFLIPTRPCRGRVCCVSVSVCVCVCVCVCVSA